MSRRGRTGEQGFTLLEVMVSLAVLGVSLVVLISIVTNNVRSTNHSRMITTATFLARTKMAALEDQILEEGFTDLDQEEDGDFGDDGFDNFRWTSLIERIELPTNAAEQAQGAAQEQTMDATNPLSMLTGMMGGLMSTMLEPIRVGLQESVRRVTLKVIWDEPGRPEQFIDVVTFLTDPSKLDLAMQAQGGGGTGTGGAGGAGGTTGGAGGTGGASGTGGAPGRRQGGAGGAPGTTPPRPGGGPR